jgi:hypothetical protein
MENKDKIFERWVPEACNIPKAINIDGVYDDYEGFRVLIRAAEGAERVYKIKFETYLGYRNIDESNRYRSLELFPCNSNEWCLFKTYNSDFINWIKNESGGKYDDDQIIHFAILTQNDILDILTLKEPTLKEL